MNNSYVILENTDLLTFLSKHYDLKTIKVLLKFKMVFVNGIEVSNIHTKLNMNDNVLIIKRDKDLFILYEDKYIIICYKPYNLLTVADKKERENTLYHKVSMYLKKKNKNSKVFIVHRLDYETSGLVIFAKSKEIQGILQNNWNDVIRNYICVVHGIFDKEKTLKYYLKENSSLMVYKSKNGSLAITDVFPIKNNSKYSLLSLNIKTGKKHQIRVSLKEEGHPILGDTKYGIKDKFKHLYLCANKLEFNHPITNKKIVIEWSLTHEYKKILS